jgi:protein-arginine kinase activator protein McsA
MTDDLVKRLREPLDDPFFGKVVEPIKWEAANRIKKLEDALRRIIERAEYRMGHHVTDAVCAIAKEALEGKDE